MHGIDEAEVLETAEANHCSVLQQSGLADASVVDERFGVETSWCDGDDVVGVRYHAVLRVDVRSNQLQRDEIQLSDIRA